MKVYIIRTGKRIYPFLDLVSESLIANRKLVEWQVAAIRRNGLEPVILDRLDQVDDREPHLVMWDNLYISPEALWQVIRESRGRSEGFIVAVDHEYYIKSFLWHQAANSGGVVPLEIMFRVHHGESPQTIRVIRFDCRKFDRERMPPHMEVNGKGFDQPLTNCILIPVENWVNLWQANIATLMALAYRLEFTRRHRQIIPFIRARGSVARASMYMNKIGKNCDIHPSAVIEASEIGDNVHIGANAVVRLAIVDKGAYISDQALLRVCVIGENAYIANNNNVAVTVVYPGSFLISGPYQFSIFGKDCAVMHCIDCDCRLDSYSIKAQVERDKVTDTKQLYLGSCYGHRVRIGAGTISAPGSAIPNDLWINPNPSQVMQQFGGDLPLHKNLFLVNGKLATKDQL